MRPTPLLLLLIGCGSPFGAALTEIDHDAQEITFAADSGDRDSGGGDGHTLDPDTSLFGGSDAARYLSQEASSEAGVEAQAAQTEADALPMKSISDACALVTHDNGFGRTWQDCSPPDAATACGSGCTLTMSWENTKASVDVSAK